jgi:hypothetical protein
VSFIKAYDALSAKATTCRFLAQVLAVESHDVSFGFSISFHLKKHNKTLLNSFLTQKLFETFQLDFFLKLIFFVLL